MAAFEERHLQGVLELCVKEGWPTYPSDPGRALRALLAPGAVSVVAFDDGGQVVGFAHGFGDTTTAYLAQLLVDPAHRRQGVGRRLLDEVAERSGAQRLDLLTDTAEGFYASFPHRAYHGFRIYPQHAEPHSDVAPAVPTLHAGGVVLRPFRPDDVGLVIAASHDPLIPLITSIPPDADETAARAWIDRQHTRVRTGVGHPFAMTDADTDTPVGQIGLWRHNVGPGRASLGYWIVDPHRRRGLAGRALAAVADWGLGDQGLDRLELHVEPWNEGSWRAAEGAEGAGFRREGLLRSWATVGD